MVNKIVLSNGGKVKLLEQKRTYLNTLKAYLWTSVAGGVPSGTTALSDFVLVVDTANVGVLPGFTAATAGTGGVAVVTGPTITWTFSYSAGTPQLINGYVVVDPADSTVVYSQVFDAAVTITAAGQQFSMAPVFNEDSIP